MQLACSNGWRSRHNRLVCSKGPVRFLRFTKDNRKYDNELRGQSNSEAISDLPKHQNYQKYGPNLGNCYCARDKLQLAMNQPSNGLPNVPFV